jgi:signal transduction histidine kinase
MFASVGRRLALLNAIVVLGILAVVSLGMFLFLQRSLDAEVDRFLRDRAAAAQIAWSDLFRTELAGSSGGLEIASLLSDDSAAEEDRDEEDDDGDEEHEDEDHDAAEELLESGDTIAYALARDGRILADARGIPVPGLPYFDALPRALEGDATTRETTIEGQRVRVYTEPVRIDGEIAGAIQVAQGQGQYEAALRVVRLATLGGLALGAVVAIPAGLFLANRSMRPIRRAFDRQKAFVADASHELRTPLTVLRAQAEALERAPDLTDRERAEGYRVMIEEVDLMSRLVADLLLLARMDSASIALSKEPHDLASIAARAVTSFEEAARQAGIHLVLEAPRPVMAHIDPERALQVIRILLDNAIAHTPPGGSIVVRVFERSGKAMLSVTDTGSGIAPDDLLHVFDRFYRADKSRSRSGGGMGLGLAIAKALMDAHHGEIAVESQPESGSTFTLIFPA